MAASHTKYKLQGCSAVNNRQESRLPRTLVRPAWMHAVSNS
jgi:hypothetical protein